MGTVSSSSASSSSPLPQGLQGVRGHILTELKRARQLTARELADRVGLSLNAVRHHMKELEAADLIQYERQHRGVGAPAFAYTLTPAGQAIFPRRYEAALTELLDHVVQHEGRDAAVAVFEARYEALTRRLREELADVKSEDRLAAVVKMLSDDGYMAEATSSAQGSTLTEHNCAIQAVAERFPEICAAEARFLSAVLGAQVDRQKHILSGCSACEYKVRFGHQENAAETQSGLGNRPSPGAADSGENV
jgi:DeoR family transcriptional regulator, suf operon transcriptional repressor